MDKDSLTINGLHKFSDFWSQCGCAGGCKYPLKGGNCSSENIVYGATVNSGTDTRFYICLCSTQLRIRYANHKNSFKCGIYENYTQLLKYICGLKRSCVDHKIFREVIKRAQPIAQYVDYVFKKQQPLYMYLRIKPAYTKEASLNCLVLI